MAKRKSIVRQGPAADVTCASCGKPLDLWTQTTSVDGLTTCAPGTGCLGGELARLREQEAEAQDEPPELPEEAYFDPADCGGTFDGFNVTSDADLGL